MRLRENPYRVFQMSKTPAGLYARQKWLGEQSTRSWRSDFENTLKKLQAGQFPDGSWDRSVVLTIRRLFGLHLTIRESNASIDRGLEWLMEKCMENFPHKRVPVGGATGANPFKGLPFSKGCSGFFLYSATLFLSSIFGKEKDDRILFVYEWLDKLGIKNSGRWCGWSCSNNILRAFVVHTEYAPSLSACLFVEALQEVQDRSGKWRVEVPFYQTVNALAHLKTAEADRQLEAAFKRLHQTQNVDGTWGINEPEWNTFLVVHAMKNRGEL